VTLKRAILRIAVGFVLAVLLGWATLWLNARHGATGGPEYFRIPRWLRGVHTFFGGLVLGIGLQVLCLLSVVRTASREASGGYRKGLVSVVWAFLLAASVVAWLFGAYLTMASGFV